MSNNSEKVLKEIKNFMNSLLDGASEAKPIPNSMYLSNLACQLSKITPLSHGGIDLIHWRWAEALRDVLYLGCLTQQKANRKNEFGDYQEIRELMRKTIIETFDEGIKYAPIRESKSK